MKLNKASLTNKELIAAGYQMPQYDVEVMAAKTKAAPKWVHLGAGNIFRAFLAAHHQHLLNEGVTDTGIIVAEGYDDEIVDILSSYDNLTINVTLKENGQVEKEILASVSDYLKMDTDSADFDTLKEIFRKSSLEMVSMTITEKGYSLVDGLGNLISAVQTDFDNGPTKPVSYLGKLVALLYERFQAGELPIALVSMDNMSHNGEKLQASVSAYVDAWVEKGLVPATFKTYVEGSSNVTFPWSMIDKITPRPDAAVQAVLEEDGLEKMFPSKTLKNTFAAPYVNGEETEYLIIEDEFPNGRPHLDKTGVIFTDRDTVNKVETMKVTTCLNPLHTCLAIFGCLLDYTSIHEEMNDEDLVKLIKILGYREGLPVVINPGIINPKQFIDEVVEKRLPNPFIPDTPQRIASDTSQKLSVRFGETIKSYLNSDVLDVQELQVIPLVFAGWLRYLTGIDDQGERFDVSSDPLLDTLQPMFADFELGKEQADRKVYAVLSNSKIFGVDLVKIGLAEKVLTFFNKMSTAPGAIRETIQTIK
ncbi:mannitol dehydrogenase family protein [Enterococcus sp. CWB-B31]|uniref:mannitol dehydrogenase family protein n=1 Tax=Enterococcus sp. CWB-B31 TaxID=2885159 RepID=UPI001E3D6F44|nr:mannitol dehydrogenase family protein [Enterococcus sp. CWB-B31]MCB5955171.1 mannitol dehydrogenase family protein [Enterococcus sp. CWB-B31]